MPRSSMRFPEQFQRRTAVFLFAEAVQPGIWPRGMIVCSQVTEGQLWIAGLGLRTDLL